MQDRVICSYGESTVSFGSSVNVLDESGTLVPLSVDVGVEAAADSVEFPAWGSGSVLRSHGGIPGIGVTFEFVDGSGEPVPVTVSFEEQS